MTKIKYLCVCNKLTQAMADCLDEVPRRGGFFNWLYLFKGDIMSYNDVEDFEKYDVVHLNGAPPDQVLVPEIRRILGNNSDTKLVFNNDHVTEVWEGWNMHYLQYWEAQRAADMVFGTEPYQVSNLIEGAYCIPHPHWIHMLKRIGRPKIENSIGHLYHWWEGRTMLPSIISYKLREKGIKHRSRLYAYMNTYDKNPKWTKALYDDLIKPMDYPKFIEQFIENKVVTDFCGYHTYGRTSVDMAAIGVPMVGSNRIESMNRCFPQLAYDPYDTKSNVESIKKLWTNERLYDEVVEYAEHAVNYYNYKNARERFMSALEDVESRKK